MRCYALVMFVGSLLAGNLWAEGEKTYYFQVICGSNKEFTPDSGARRIGSKLRSQLETKFRWKSYVEVSHGEFILREPKVTTIKLPEKREMQLELHGRLIEARLYRDGELVRKMREPADARSLIMGGDQGKDDSWFIVIRQDKPGATPIEQAKRTD